MNQNKYRIDFANLPISSPTPGMKSKSYGDEHRQIRWVEFSQEFVELDWCRKGHIGYVLAGVLEVQFGDRKVTFNSGDGIFTPAGEKSQHKAKAITEIVQLLLVEEL